MDENPYQAPQSVNTSNGPRRITLADIPGILLVLTGPTWPILLYFALRLLG